MSTYYYFYVKMGIHLHVYQKSAEMMRYLIQLPIFQITAMRQLSHCQNQIFHGIQNIVEKNQEP